MPTSPQRILHFDFAKLELFENYIIATIRDGILFDIKEQQQLYQVFKTYYAEQPFGYISNRKNDYTVNPTTYLQATHFENLVGMGVICYSEVSIQNAHFERSFYDRPYEIFSKVEEATDWVDHQIKNYNKKIAGL